MRPALLLALLALPAVPAWSAEVTVMTFNVWGAGLNEEKPIDETVAAIRAAGADIVGIQETRSEGPDCTAEHCPPSGESRAPALAAALGFHLYEQTRTNEALWSNAVLSRWPITGATANDLGVAIDMEGTPIFLFNIHLDDAPYQPYQLLGIEYGPYPYLTTAEEAVAAAAATRGPALDLLEADLAEAAGAAAVFLTGDFNEPSHRDWTAEAVAAGRHPLPVAWPTTRRIEALGFVDGYRTAHPDPVAKPAFTWTPAGDPADPEDHHDRIDFVFGRAPGIAVISAATVGEAAETSETVVTPWPADHRAVAARFRF